MGWNEGSGSPWTGSSSSDGWVNGEAILRQQEEISISPSYLFGLLFANSILSSRYIVLLVVKFIVGCGIAAVDVEDNRKIIVMSLLEVLVQ